MLTAVLEQPRRRLQHRRDRRLVVGAEDRAAGVPDEAVLADHRLEPPLQRDGVEVRAQEERRARRAVPLDPAEDVPDLGADLRPRVVLAGLQPERGKVLEHAVGDGPLLPRRTRDRREREE